MKQMNQEVDMDQVLQAAKSATKNSKQEMNAKFPHILYKLLEDETVPQAMWWLDGGKEFAINSDLFPKQVLDVYMNGTKFASWIRRLHKMGFSRQTRTLKKVYGGQIPHHAIAFRHENFQKNRPELLDKICKLGQNKEGTAKKQMKMKAEDRKRNNVPSAVSTYGMSSVTSSIADEVPPAMVTSNVASLQQLKEQHKQGAVPVPAIPASWEPSAANVLLQLGAAKREQQQADVLLLLGTATTTTSSSHIPVVQGSIEEPQSIPSSGAIGASQDPDTLLLIQEIHRRRQVEQLLMIEQERHMQAYMLAQQQAEQELALRRRLLAAAMFEEQARQQQEQQQHQLFLLQQRQRELQQGEQQAGSHQQQQQQQQADSAGESVREALLRLQLLQRLQRQGFDTNSGFF